MSSLGNPSAKPRTAHVAVLSFVGGVVVALGTPPFNLYPCFWIGLAVWAYALRGVGGIVTGRQSILSGLLFGVGANLTLKRFIPATLLHFTPVGLPAAIGLFLVYCIFESLRWAVAAWVAQKGMRLGARRSLSFGAGAFLASFVPSIIAWDVASGISPWPIVNQIAELIGQRGVGAVMAITASLMASAVERGASRGARRTAAIVATSIVSFQVFYGAVRLAAFGNENVPHVKVALVQPNFDAKDRWTEGRQPALLAKLTALTIEAERLGAVLTVWPENAYPYPVAHASRQAPIGDAAPLQFGVHGPVLLGLITTSNRGVYNSAAVATQDGALSEPQDKMRLMWFGETLPVVGGIDWIRRAFPRVFGLVAGREALLQKAGAVRAGVLNCVEDTLPSVALDVMREEPNLLVNITNDAWFSPSAQSEIHLRMSALRAIEARRDFVRAVNGGVTAWVDATGRVRARLENEGVLIAEPALREGKTIYVMAGDLPLLILFTAGMVSSARRRDGKTANA